MDNVAQDELCQNNRLDGYGWKASKVCLIRTDLKLQNNRKIQSKEEYTISLDYYTVYQNNSGLECTPPHHQ